MRLKEPLKIRIVIDLGAAWTSLVNLARKFRIGHFLLLYLAAHMLQIAFPSDGSMVFDEAYYIPASVATLQGVAANAEHPPLPKILGGIGIGLLGNNWFGWRFPQVLMQVAALYLFYLIAKRLLGDPWALGATMLLGLDTIYFIHGGTLLIDMPMFLFGFLAVELYFRKHYGWSAVSMGLTLLSREMSIFLFITLAAYHLVANRSALKPALKTGLRYGLIALIVFGGLLWAYDIRYLPPSSTSVTDVAYANVVLGSNGTAITTVTSMSQITSAQVMWNPIQHLLFIYNYHGPNGLVINQTYESYDYAWNWILPIHFGPKGGNVNATIADLFNSPSYYRVDVDVSTAAGVTHYIPIWYDAQANLALWYMIWPGLVALLIALKRRYEVANVTFILVGIFSNYIPWLVLSIAVRRIGFNYYMIYTLPFVALAAAFFWKILPPRYGKTGLVLNVAAAALFFITFFPVRPMP